MSESCIVYEHPLSPYAQKVKLALREKGIPFEVHTPGFGSEQEAAEFSAISPRREVPVLVHAGQTYFESSLILAYIEETWPTPALLPTDPTSRAKARIIENVLDTHFEANTWGLGEVHIFGRADTELAATLTQYAKDQIEGWFAWLEEQLAGEDWFNGATYGYADLCVAPHLNSAGRFDVAPTPNSALSRWLARANAHPNVATTQAEAVAAELDPTTMQAAIAAGFQREYRDHRLEWMVQAGGLDIVAKGLVAGTIRFNQAFR